MQMWVFIYLIFIKSVNPDLTYELFIQQLLSLEHNCYLKGHEY